MDARNLPKSVTRALLICTAAGVLLKGPASAEVQYTVTELGSMGGDKNSALAINNQGQVLCRAYDISEHNSTYVLWDPTTGMRNLSSLLEEGARVTGMNDLGQFAVWKRSLATHQDQAYLWDGVNTPEYLGNFYPMGLNSNGRVYGHTSSAPDHYDPPTGVVWDRMGGLRVISALPGGSWTEPSAINYLGRTAGYCDSDIEASGHPTNGSFRGPPGVQHRIFLCDEAGGVIDIGSLGGDYCWATGINSAGQVVGTSYTGNGDETHAFLWDPAEGMMDLGALPGQDDSGATAINDLGQVIGGSGQFDFMWCPVSGMQVIDDLVPEDLRLSRFWITGINNAGQMVGEKVVGSDIDPVYGEYDTTHVIVLTPIPEPGALTLFALGLIAVGVRNPARRKSIGVCA